MYQKYHSLIVEEIPIFLVEIASDRSSLTHEKIEGISVGIPRPRRSVWSYGGPVDTEDTGHIIAFRKRLQVSANGARLPGGRFQAIIKISSIGMSDKTRGSPFSKGMKKRFVH